MDNPTEQTDVVKEARALAEKFDSAFNIGADPRDVYLDDLVRDWHKAQSLLKTLADEVDRLRKVAAFAAHTTDCKWRLHVPRTDCTCGLDKLLENDNEPA